MKAMARDGRAIDVRRRWLPWKPRLRDVDSSGGDAGGFDLGDDLAGVAVVIAIFLLLLFFPVVLAVALLAGEVLVLLLLLPLFLVARVVPVQRPLRGDRGNRPGGSCARRPRRADRRR